MVDINHLARQSDVMQGSCILPYDLCLVPNGCNPKSWHVEFYKMSGNCCIIRKNEVMHTFYLNCWLGQKSDDGVVCHSYLCKSSVEDQKVCFSEAVKDSK